MSSVLITGASKGIGRATAQEFARRGWSVIATARDPKSLSDLDATHKLALDVTDQASVDAAVQAAGEVDVLLSNAGVIFYAAVEEAPLPEIERIFQQNLFGAIRVTQAVLPQMRARRSGRLLYLSSVLGRIVMPGSGAYAATKWALEAFAQTLALELKPFDVGVSLLEPGAVSSGALDDVLKYSLPGEPYADIWRQRAASSAPMLTTEDVATAIVDAAEAPQAELQIPIGALAASRIAG